MQGSQEEMPQVSQGRPVVTGTSEQGLPKRSNHSLLQLVAPSRDSALTLVDYCLITDFQPALENLKPLTQLPFVDA